ncbi:hypothetical protein EN742_18765 [Mesorhizobium sp. M4A.F.Ca.ET.020.02.1.1]|uniref:hypothetical protein n=1 Tax=unclassified Mesorhizobium TaxID=325217 RepID=UPI000FCA45E3|nr:MULTISPECIES: hypothetical protein [unclassified Mesorhizobium]RUX52127.1 hypothetical protein EOA33_03795 [Mesorhizobium sp. M4A.F.Ca.ET.050.02.1.1]RVD38021.1 hypothetical protein EN742_18765 [Mesorhizobium sp. M4A.F.Ca.ET.020.02.1.1]RWC21096.1 MAG: hypothetical protein EOS53_07080 [Mesorhizobium sp.]RWD29644.1 MAG: hypothetical protein EOS22_08520 [Mesorhizobium sp.]RWD36094.1 MAG: hypothetical protein EOS33_05425 [Mesorhizobium sp.]
MKSAIILFALGAMLAPTALRAADYCDDKLEPGESIDGKAMAMVSSMFSIGLAERYCGAPPMPLSQIFVIVEEAHGCGPRARLEDKFKKTMEEEGGPKVTTTAEFIREMLSEGGNDLPQAELDRQARAAIETELGGCGELLKMQRDFQERYRNPPQWPPEPERP